VHVYATPLRNTQQPLLFNANVENTALKAEFHYPPLPGTFLLLPTLPRFSGCCSTAVYYCAPDDWLPLTVASSSCMKWLVIAVYVVSTLHWLARYASQWVWRIWRGSYVIFLWLQSDCKQSHKSDI